MLDWSDIICRLGAATAIGAIIGVNRDLHHKPSGLRTLGLVSLGAALVVLIAAESSADPSSSSRALQGIITGLGFLGGGVIVHEATATKVHGLTTAAAIWVTACLGAACGLGAWRSVIVACGLVGVLLLAGGRLEKWLRARFGREGGKPDAGA